jgi:type II secretory pathway pseudopilin PulG
MNRWLRGLSVLAFLFLHSGSSWALCEAEFDAFARADKVDPVEYRNKLGAAALEIKRDQPRKLTLENLKNAEDDLRTTLTEYHTELMVARRKAWICLYKWVLDEKVVNNANSGQTNSNSSSASNQSLQPYKPGTSTLERYLTAPKEDCDAIPQSYNVSDRQFSVSQCRLRNANRDKYAANANAASAQPATNVQSAQQKAQQAQLQAQQSQARADQARLGKRKTHDPAAEAHQCIDVDVDAPIVGGFRNKCGYAVSYGYCVFNPKKGGWTDSPIFNCNAMIGKTTAGGQDIKANGYDVNHTRGGESVYFFACKQPASAMDLTFISGQGIQGRCGNLMGN